MTGWGPMNVGEEGAGMACIKDWNGEPGESDDRA